jgi:hypothetical protein
MRSHWKLIAAFAVIFLVGVGIGSAGGENTADAEPEVRTVIEAETNTVSETVTETVDPTEEQVAALDDREAALDDRAANLDARAQTLRQRERGLEQRAAKLRRQERVAARSRFGDGVYLVGKDIPAGSYVARGSSGCYWARLSRNGNDILGNHFGAGQVRATINSGELFETQGCGTWRPG